MSGESDKETFRAMLAANETSAGKPGAASAAACKFCGANTLRPKSKEITQKKRVKFGIFWILVSCISLGFGLILWLILPRKNVVVSVDRWVECSNCGARA
jgi:hypothetical protein